jgi:PAS domain S-box-containing protein
MPSTTTQANSVTAMGKEDGATRLPFLAHFFGGKAISSGDPLLTAVLLLLILVVTVMESFDLIIQPTQALRWILIIATVDGLGLALLGVNERGRTRLASIVLVAGLLLIITVAAATAGGIHSPAATCYLTVVFIGGLLLGVRAGGVTAVLCCVCGLGLVFAERKGVLPPNPIRNNEFSLWLGTSVNMGLIIGLQYFAARTAKNALQQAQEELAERQRNETALRLSEKRYREVFENTSDCMFLLDVMPAGGFKVVQFNPAEEKSVGISNAEAAGRLIQEIVPPDIANILKANFRRCVETGCRLNYEEQLDLPVGRRYFDTTLIPVRDVSGQIYRIVGIAHNITERKQTAEHLRRSEEQLRALSSRIQSLREEERTRIAREIHDHLGQLLTALKFDLRLVQRKISGVSDLELRAVLNGKIATATELTDETVRSVQKIASELRSGVLDQLGLEAAIKSEAQAFQARTGIRCEWSFPTNSMEVTAEHATAAFRIYQEILTNIARHAHATEVVVWLSIDGSNLMLEVEDNGVGIKDVEIADAKSLGILGMQERATLLGGTVMFQRNSNKGTTVTVQIPLNKTIGEN